ncbi:uncharacterized protein LOC112574695 [Pomacea canaliculata]|uniref:uncharacterized protein LOC112574695 n=1 Tax=Pomacea canaliculata TaxID=400727 RepID=UPI000D72A685|nr:uncharacterized protein LOC112574695 [Pomacea canaliculata]
MSGHPPPASQQGSRRSGGGGEDVRSTRGSGRGGGGRVTFYLHAVTDEQAAVLTDDSNQCSLQEIKMKTGADVQLDSNPSPVPGMKIVVIQGVPGQIEAAVGFISEKTGVQETISVQAQAFWLQWVEAAFPDLDSRAYFLPPVYVNRVPMTRQSVSDQNVLVLHPSSTQGVELNQATRIPSTAAQDSISQPSPVQDSDIREDKAMERLLVCLQTMSEQNKEVLVGISHLRYGQYLGEPCYAAAAAHLPSTKTFPSGLSRDRQGNFDLLLIHRHYGLVVCQVKAFGSNWSKCDMFQQDICSNLKIKLKEAIQSLNKAEAMLSHLVSDIASGLRITKTIAFPNLTARQVQQAVSDDTHTTEELCRCLGTSDSADIPETVNCLQ